tara:strand:+ start:3712 stop:4584 length:873 start_codon:yes stop_codon:yes gene_type:complete
MKISFLILGSNGTLGKKIFEELVLKKKFIIKTVAKKNADFCINLEKFDKLENIFKNNKFNFVINCAAYTNLKYCEKNYKKTLKINTYLPKKLSQLSIEYNFRYIHISTDHIYISKKNIANSEKFKIGWHNYYSKSKYLAEKNILANSKSLIIRTNFIDDSSNKKSFLYWLNNNFNKKKEIPLFHDMYTSTIDLKTFSKILIKLTLTKSFGIFNIGANEILSKKEFAIKYFKNLKKNLKYKDVSANNTKLIALKRGKYLGLNIKKVEKKLKIKMPSSIKVIKNLVYENTRN